MVCKKCGYRKKYWLKEEQWRCADRRLSTTLNGEFQLPIRTRYLAIAKWKCIFFGCRALSYYEYKVGDIVKTLKEEGQMARDSEN